MKVSFRFPAALLVGWAITPFSFSWALSKHNLAHEDLIEELPLYGPPPTSQYSGFLDATKGCDTDANGPECKVFYWLAEAENDPDREKPLILWLNGGPGASSVFGMLQELGPLILNATGNGFMENPWAWTKVANLLILESPLGVGFSYCEAMTRGEKCMNTDRTTASLNRAALEEFYRKFPEFADKKLYLTGESYSGVYVPLLAKKLLDSSPGIQLAGLAVGNPCTDNESQRESMNRLWYSNKYGLVDPDIYKILNDKTCIVDGIAQFDEPKCRIAFYKYWTSSSHGIKTVSKFKETFLDKFELYGFMDRSEGWFLVDYMNREDVRKALHTEYAPTSHWWSASTKDDIGYIKEFRACSYHDDIVLEESMVDIYRDIIPRLERTWIFNGDADPTVSYEGTRLAVKHQVGFDEVDGGGYRPWFYNHTAAPINVIMEKPPKFGPDLIPHPLGSQFGGEVEDYQHGLSFFTVHGGGHMVSDSFLLQNC